MNSLSSTTTRVSWHQKGRTILDFNKARNDRVAVAAAGPYANHLQLTADRWPCQHLITQFFYRPDALLDVQPTLSKLSESQKYLGYEQYST